MWFQLVVLESSPAQAISLLEGQEPFCCQMLGVPHHIPAQGNRADTQNLSFYHMDRHTCWNVLWKRHLWCWLCVLSAFIRG